MNATFIKGSACIAIPALLLLFPVPEGLTPQAWKFCAVYIGAILGLILRPMPEPVVLLAAIAVASLGLNETNAALSGFGGGTAWLVFAAFIVGQCFLDTGLGKRISYHIIRLVGGKTLNLGYAVAIADYIMSPAMPSNTARTGGIVFPIFNSLVKTLEPSTDGNPRPVGAYIMANMYQVSLTTSALFITASAVPALIMRFAKDITGVDIAWGEYALAMSVPGLLSLLLIPLMIYKIYTPTLKTFDNKKLADDGLRELGPITTNEIKLTILFVLALLGWGTSMFTKLNSTGIAIAFCTMSLLLGILTWNRVLECKGAWSTLIWYAGIISLAGGLNKHGFFKWLGTTMQSSFNFDGHDKIVILLGLILISIVVRYVFASSAAFVASMMPVLLTLGHALEVPAYPLVLMLTQSAIIGSVLTHYGNAAAPIIFSTGYVSTKMWWLIGHITTFVVLAIFFTVGLQWWKFLGLW
ncbi:MAG: Inner membrane protein YbhI [Desulfovibrio sp.]